MKKINLGGGNTKIDGFINLDIIQLPNVDIVCDLTKGIPLEDNSVNEVYCSHFLEHTPDLVLIMEEIWRVCIPGALVGIKCPYYKSSGAFKDPTHVRFMTEKTFEYFDKNNIKYGKLPDYKINANFQTQKIKYIWSSTYTRLLPFKSFFLNHFWNIARTIYYELVVVK